MTSRWGGLGPLYPRRILLYAVLLSTTALLIQQQLIPQPTASFLVAYKSSEEIAVVDSEVPMQADNSVQRAIDDPFETLPSQTSPVLPVSLSSAPPAIPSVEVIGIGYGNVRFAVIRFSTNGKVQRIQEGDKIEDGSVIAIRRTSITLRSNGKFWSFALESKQGTACSDASC